MRKLSDVVFEQRPLILRQDATAFEACRLMQEASAGSIVVVDDRGHLAGIFTGRDVVGRIVAAGRDASTTRLADVMTPDPVTISPEQSAVDALRLMWDGGFRHVPLVRQGKVVGVVSRGDFRGVEHDRHEQERDLWEHMR